ncbi:MAG TPA: hypothetical protein VM659_00975 [Dongiaceae bacterium]|nr:hypothetical protein [Dongiaceae bacterium]
MATKLLYLHEPDFRPSPGPKPKSVAARRKLLAFFEASEFKRVDTFAKWLVAPADGKKKQRLPAEFKGKGFDTVRDAIRRAKRERKEERDEAARQMYGAGAIIAMQRRLGKN